MKRGLSPPLPQGSVLPFKSLVPMSREALARPSDERVAVRAGSVDLRPHSLHFLPALPPSLCTGQCPLPLCPPSLPLGKNFNQLALQMTLLSSALSPTLQSAAGSLSFFGGSGELLSSQGLPRAGGIASGALVNAPGLRAASWWPRIEVLITVSCFY